VSFWIFGISTLLHVVPRTILAHCSWYNIWHFFHSNYCYIALVHLGVVVEVIYFLASERGTLWEYQDGLINMSGEWRQTPTDLVHLQQNICCRRFAKILFKTAVKGYYKSHAFTTFWTYLQTLHHLLWTDIVNRISALYNLRPVLFQ